MCIPSARLVQLAVQLRDSPRRQDSLGNLPVQRVSASRRDDLAQLPATTSGPPTALGGVTEMTTAEVRSIAVRIEARLQSIAEHEAAIRMDLEALASLSSPAADDHLLDVSAAAQWLGVSRATMFRLLRSDNQLRHLKVGKRTLFRPDDLRSYAARQVAS